jgi:hypothetical protein
MNGSLSGTWQGSDVVVCQSAALGVNAGLATRAA